jgi:hypothetical protein
MNRATGSTLQNQDIVAGTPVSRYIIPVKSLTKQEQLVLCIVLGLLLTGWAVKTWRTAHPVATKQNEGAPPAAAATQQAKP